MDKGIRPAMNIEFAKLLPQRQAIGDKKFRKTLIFWAVEEFGISVAAACTHYNTAKHTAAKNPELAAMMIGLGRAPEKNNGGRKKKVVEAAPAAPSVIPVPVSETLNSLLLGSETPEGEENTEEATPEGVAETAPAPEQTTFTVKVKKTGEVVAEGVSFDDAKALVQAAKDAKKKALYWA